MYSRPSASEVEQLLGKAQAVTERFVIQLFEPPVWAQLMRGSATHHWHNPHNCMLIIAQRPDVTDLRTLDQWHELGCQVTAGEKPIALSTPDYGGLALARHGLSGLYDGAPTVHAQRHVRRRGDL
jgi:hypothetical protein